MSVLRAEREAREAERQRRRAAQIQAEFEDIQQYLMAVTNERSRKIVRLRRGPDRLMLKEIAKKLGLTGERVRQLEGKAMRQIMAAKRRGGRVTDETKIADAPISLRLENILRRMRVKTVGQIRAKPLTTLLNQRGFGSVSLAEINAILDQANAAHDVDD